MSYHNVFTIGKNYTNWTKFISHLIVLQGGKKFLCSSIFAQLSDQTCLCSDIMFYYFCQAPIVSCNYSINILLYQYTFPGACLRFFNKQAYVCSIRAFNLHRFKKLQSACIGYFQWFMAVSTASQIFRVTRTPGNPSKYTPAFRALCTTFLKMLVNLANNPKSLNQCFALRAHC